jgi:K+-sensing histidine kinase KdpD
LALVARHLNLRNVELPLLLFAVAATAWYAGPLPAALALLLSIAFFDFFFTEPYYTFAINAPDIPYFMVFTSFALLVAWFSTVRRRVERELVEAAIASRSRWRAANPAGQSPEFDTRLDFRLRHGFRDQLLESGCPGTLWVDA